MDGSRHTCGLRRHQGGRGRRYGRGVAPERATDALVAGFEVGGEPLGGEALPDSQRDKVGAAEWVPWTQFRDDVPADLPADVLGAAPVDGSLPPAARL